MRLLIIACFLMIAVALADEVIAVVRKRRAR